MSSLVLQGVSKRFGGIDAVRQLDLRVNDCELVTLVGPSGCGKTTTLKLIAGLEQPSSGTIQIGDRTVNTLEARHRNVAMVFQDDGLQPHMTIARNLSFGLQMRRLPRQEIESRVNEVAQRFGIQDWLQRMPHQLSGGQRQRVALARSLVRNPDVFLFDEPLSNLDAPLRADLRAELARRRNEFAAAVLYVTHDQQEALALADRVAIMRDGRIEQEGSPREVYQRPVNRFVARFLGSPPINMMRGNIQQVENGWAFRSGSLSVELGRPDTPVLKTGQLVWLAIRAEHLRPNQNGAANLVGPISSLQYLGSETIAEFRVDDVSLVSRLPSEMRLSVGDQLRTTIDTDRCLLFDGETDDLIEFSAANV